MPSNLEFCLLGPMAVRRDGVVVPVPRGSQRTVLAALLLGAGRVVPTGELAEALWGAAPVASAPVTMRNYVKRLRRALGDPGQSVIVTQPPGYLIRGADLDVTRFEALLAGAGTAARGGAWAAAARQAEAALALCRGEPLADVPSDALVLREVPRLAELRVQAAELGLEARLRLGQQAGVITELAALAAAHPLREHVHALLMLALYRDGRQADALAAYRRARRLLVTEIGAEPGAELTGLHQRILAADPALAGPAPGSRPAGPRVAAAFPAPRQLPGPVRQFTGRTAELAFLTGLLDTGLAQAPSAVVISAIAGTAGLGKTALAVRWAHQVTDRFPDGQLHVNLRGFDAGEPVPPAEALAGFLRALGVAGPDIPPGTEERAARYRSLLDGRRMLVLLDNAGTAEQVRPLLPGSPSCVTVVTSRAALSGLVARDGARRLDLSLPTPAQAAELLAALIGERASGDPAATAALAARCARLPLALRLAAELAAARPGVPLAAIAGELASEQRPLDLLDGDGDAGTAVRAVFSWSLRHLDDGTARAFRLAGLHPGGEFDCHAVAALTGTAGGQARRMLDRLAACSLVHRLGPDRYGMHDLLRAYAAELAAERDAETGQRAALTRLLDHYLVTAGAAGDALFPADPDRPRISVAADPAPPLASPAAARAWLDGHRQVLVRVAAHAAGHGWPGHAVGLAETAFRYADACPFADAAVMHRHACRAAAQAGDGTAQAAALTRLGTADAGRGRLGQAEGHLRRALALYRQSCDRAGEACALDSLGFIVYCQGDYGRSAGYCRRALALYRQAGGRPGEARARQHLGLIDLRQGRTQQAARQLRRSLALFRAAGVRSGEAHVLCSLGELELRRARYALAAGHFRHSLELCREGGIRATEARVLTYLSLADLHRGHRRQAAGQLRRSLALHTQAGDLSGQAEARNGLGEVLLAAGRDAPARREHAAALTLARRAGDRYGQARAHDGLAGAWHAAGQDEHARRHRRQARVLYQGLGAAEAASWRAPTG
ncbi:MAG TPA: BTAD domain-containing putative transcriptional regulator [Streptosporangiaceae bacterium]